MSESRPLYKGPCPKCGSRDNFVRYDDGHGYCFGMGCGYFEPGDKSPGASLRAAMSADLLEGEVRPLVKRNISEETCRKFRYMVGNYRGKPVQIAPYFDSNGRMVAQKLRFPDKTFKVLGSINDAGLFGQHLWGQGGRKVIITEGEIDAMSVSQAQGNKWPVVSVPNGAQGASRAVKKALEWLESFEEVIFMFDMDEPGRKAAAECAQLLAPGKAYIAEFAAKDPNELLQQGRVDEIIRAIWNPRQYRPDGILAGEELWDRIQSYNSTPSIPYPWEGLNAKTRGMRHSEIVTWTAGSGVGKSAVMREIAHHLIRAGHTVGMIMLEEDVGRSALGLMGISLNLPLHLSKDGVHDDDLRRAFNETLGTGRVYLYDHFGSTEVDNLLSKVRYMARALGCRWVILDHLSIVVSGLGEGDERRLIDNTMTLLRTLVQETGIGLHLVSHLRRPEGRGHEEGAKTSLAQLRGSSSIAQLSDLVIGLERNQQGDDPHFTTVRVLKNRFSGETGEATYLRYNPLTGRLYECDPEDTQIEDIDDTF